MILKREATVPGAVDSRTQATLRNAVGTSR
jgi:hypothetical protein